MGFYLDGRTAAVYGTHTHVPTADARINPNGTGYQTDIGMTGPKWSVLGIKPEQSIAMFRGDLTSRFEPAEGPCCMNGVLFTIDPSSGRCTAVERIEEDNG
jgi:calcineurin-like phosphoesterase